MSYILDALRKSEQQRQQGVAPTLRAVQTLSVEDTESAWMIYGLVAAALVAGGAAVGMWHPWQKQAPFASEPIPLKAPEPALGQSLQVMPLPVRPEKAGEPRESLQEQSVQESLTPVARHDAPAAATVEHGRQAVTEISPRTRKAQPPASAKMRKRAATPIHRTTAAHRFEKAIVPPTQEKFVTAAPKDTSPERKVISMAELPSAIRQEIPRMSISVHSYSSSSPQARIVGINERLLQEGEYLAPGLKLEQIAPDGIIFSYKEYLFRHGLH